MADKIIVFGASEGFGTLVGWESKGTSVPDTKTRAAAMTKMGDEIASHLHDEKIEATENLECNNNTNTIPTKIGDFLNSLYILTQIAITTSLDAYASMTLTGHNHGTNPHAASPALRTSTHGKTLVKCFGATDFLGGTAGDNASPIAGSLTIKIDHADQNDMGGDHLVGENHNPMMEAHTTWAGVPTVPADVLVGWDLTVATTTDERTGFKKTEVTGIKRLTIS